ncbi:hypothetical protein, partial [Desulfofustis glycolicus]|uniref:hypothetical protein n=1 Tax=Desulfofustis glycolicus TaxID=51195 RepID=UPI001ABF6500
VDQNNLHCHGALINDSDKNRCFSFRYCGEQHQLGLVAPAFQATDQVGNIGFEVLRIGMGTDLVDAAGG